MKELQPLSDALNRTVGQHVAEDYRTAKIFEKYGIDFCCGGMVTIADTCREKKIDPINLLLEIESVKLEPLERSMNYDAWELPFLADYIVNTHHAYLKENVEKIAGYTRKIAEVHGKNHPEVIEVARIFGKAAADLIAHLGEEEELLFPAIRRIDGAQKRSVEPDEKDIDLIQASMERLDREHEEVGEAVHEIRRLTRDFAIPGDACNTFRVTYSQLKEFEEDLHKHVHLENNILFPKASRIGA